MELSPKQQSVEQIKNAAKVLILGHKKPDGDMIGSALALGQALKEQGKTIDIVFSEDVSGVYTFLPFLETVKQQFEYIEGKLLRIDTTKVPVKGLKYQKTEEHLDIFLDAEKNLKFEFIEIINGIPKPDLIIVLDTPDVEHIDSAYDTNPELFYEIPIINIDHHPGNEYFGTVNMVDLTATSTSEILVSLLEALGYKITSPDVATCLLTGIISDTQSFRSSTTTPKSLTVAAQLLAAGGRQQEIISNLYKKRPMALLKLWGKMLSGIQKDEAHSFAWTKVSLLGEEKGIGVADVLDAADELLTNTPETKMILILCEDRNETVYGKIKGSKGVDITETAKALNASGNNVNATFKASGKLDELELKTLKKIHDLWSDKGETKTGNLWDVVEDESKLTPPVTPAEIEAATEPDQLESQLSGEKLSTPQTEIEKEATTETFSTPQTEKEIQAVTPEEELYGPNGKAESDAIDNALKSLSENKTETKGFTPLKEIMNKKREDLNLPKKTKEEEIDVFDEENE